MVVLDTVAEYVTELQLKESEAGIHVVMRSETVDATATKAGGCDHSISMLDNPKVFDDPAALDDSAMLDDLAVTLQSHDSGQELEIGVVELQ